MKLRLALILILILLFNKQALANPNQFGSSGLLNVPTADTLDSANFCVGLWGNCSSKSNTGISTIMPATLTLGLSTFWEVYGTYPNVYLNNDDRYSGRGTADVGTKMRMIGGRSDRFKLAADFQLSRYIDDDPVFNGVTNMGGRLIASLRSDILGVHLYTGYMSNGDSRDVVNKIRSSTEFPAGAGFEISPSTRTKATIELTASDSTKLTAPIEASIGFQYFLTPHLTLNLSYAMGVNEAAPEWRALLGLSTCQGVGAYIKPVPVVTRKGDKGPIAKAIRATKMLPLSPLLIKTPALTTPASKFEVPVDAEGDEILIRPYGNVIIAQQPAATPVISPKLAAVEQQTAEVSEPVTEPLAAAPGETPSEFSLTRVSGITPLYGVRVKGKGDKLTLASPVGKPPGPVSVYRKFRLPDQLFEFDNADMIPEVQKSVSELAEFIRKDEKWVFLRIDGHTDGVGSVKYNMDLSLRRAITVANYLVLREGIDPSRVFVRGMGKSAPIADNSTDEGRTLNRRFEIVFLVNKEKQK
jgi:outer membrane protein OmpA-like peptidoglycan-associated protein